MNKDHFSDYVCLCQRDRANGLAEQSEAPLIDGAWTAPVSGTIGQSALRLVGEARHHATASISEAGAGDARSEVSVTS